MSNVPLPEPDGVVKAMWNVVRHGPNYDGRERDVIAAAKAYAERYAAAFSAAKDAEIAGLRAEMDLQPCGHPKALLVKSAETGEPLYCEACDDRSGRCDAEACETELAEANKALRARVRVLEDALRAMLTHMGMDEDEWNKPTFDQARAALEQKS